MFNFGFDKKTIIIIAAVILLIWLATAGTEGILSILLVIPAVLIALTFHEFAHAYAAYKLGDETAKQQGRLTLNPLKHIDPVGFIFLVVAGFGWGKPVQIDPRNFNGKYSLSKAEAIVAIAGPIMNFVLAFIFLFLYYILFQVTDVLAGLSTSWYAVLYTIIIYIVTINVGLGVFNLIPLPPLDGSKVLMHFLSYNGKQWFINNQSMFYIIFLILWITGLASSVIRPLIGLVFNGLDWVVRNLIGLF